MDASQICPKCGWAREPKAVDCPACGIVYARYGGAAQRQPPPTPSSGEAVNPYAPPRSEVQTPVEAPPLGQTHNAGVWRSSASLLVMQKGMQLPSRCLVCNGPAAVHFPKKMHWHHPGLYLLLFLGGPLIYIVGALVARKKADVVLPFCTQHAEKRKKSAVLSTLLIVIGFVAMMGSCTQIEGDGTSFALIFLVGFVILVAGAIVSAVGANLIIPKKIDDYYVWLGKVSGSYLSTLPPAPPGL